MKINQNLTRGLASALNNPELKNAAASAGQFAGNMLTDTVSMGKKLIKAALRIALALVFLCILLGNLMTLGEAVRWPAIFWIALSAWIIWRNVSKTVKLFKQ